MTKALMSIQLELAWYLIEIYKRNFELVEWFMQFRVERAEHVCLLFLAVRYRWEYAIILKRSGQLSRALKQFLLVKQLLVEQFGDNYAVWLPDTPNVEYQINALKDEMAGSYEMGEA